MSEKIIYQVKEAHCLYQLIQRKRPELVSLPLGASTGNQPGLLNLNNQCRSVATVFDPQCHIRKRDSCRRGVLAGRGVTLVYLVSVQGGLLTCNSN